jgi:hypothetical protein
VFAGIVTVNVEVDVLVFPKSKTHTAPFAPALYIKAPRAVIAPVHDGEVNEMYVTLPEDVVCDDTVAVTTCPPAA